MFADSLSASAAGPAGAVMFLIIVLSVVQLQLSDLQQQKSMTARVTMQMEQTVRALSMAVPVTTPTKRMLALLGIVFFFYAYCNSCCVCWCLYMCVVYVVQYVHTESFVHVYTCVHDVYVMTIVCLYNIMLRERPLQKGEGYLKEQFGYTHFVCGLSFCPAYIITEDEEGESHCNIQYRQFKLQSSFNQLVYHLNLVVVTIPYMNHHCIILLKNLEML